MPIRLLGHVATGEEIKPSGGGVQGALTGGLGLQHEPPQGQYYCLDGTYWHPMMHTGTSFRDGEHVLLAAIVLQL